MQAITTKFLESTNYRCSRVKAECAAGSITRDWNHELDIDENHDAAFRALVRKLNYWTKGNERRNYTWTRGTLKDGRNVYTLQCDFTVLEV